MAALASSVFLVYREGYATASGAVFLGSAFSLVLHYKQPHCGLSLGWGMGQWYILTGSGLTNVELQRGWLCLPWLVRIAVKDPQSGCSFLFFLFPDSAEPAALCHLRRRLYMGA